jgi:hypothetical protein
MLAMTILYILKIVAVVGTLGTGLISLIWPRAIRGFTGLNADGPRGITEIRAVMGGVFIGLGIAALLLNLPANYQMLGIMYLVIAVVRTASMIIDKSVQQSNVISVAVEIIFGIILVI